MRRLGIDLRLLPLLKARAPRWRELAKDPNISGLVWDARRDVQTPKWVEQVQRLGMQVCSMEELIQRASGD